MHRLVVKLPGMDNDLSIGAALERLDAWCSEQGDRDAQLALRPGANDRDLDELRRAIDPYEIPPEVLSLLRWHDGQKPECEFDLMPIDDGGPLLGTGEMAEGYLWLRDAQEPWQWNPLWLPVLRHRWTQVAVEIAPQGPGVVLENYYGDTSLEVICSSLAAFMHAAADLAEAGLLLRQEHEAWDTECKRLKEARSEQVGWSHWPYERSLPNDEQGVHWPPYWRAARGFGVGDAD